MNWQYLPCAGRHVRFIGQVPYSARTGYLIL